MLDQCGFLLRSEHKLSASVLRLLSLAGCPAQHVISCTEIEQDFFLVDKTLHSRRLDLERCRCMVYGIRLSGTARPEIASRLDALSRDFEEAARLLELEVCVSPRGDGSGRQTMRWARIQTSLSAQKQQLAWKLMQQVAMQHQFACVFPLDTTEHIRFSLITDTGKNLFESDGDRFVQAALAAAMASARREHARLLSTAISGFTNDTEFQMVEGVQGISWPMAVLHASVADCLHLILDKVEDQGGNLPEALQIAPASSETIVSAWAVLRDPKTERAFQGIMSSDELIETLELFYKRYVQQMSCKSEAMIELFRLNILPAALEYQKKSAQPFALEVAAQAIDALEKHYREARGLGREALSRVFAELIAPRMERARLALDALEQEMSAFWPLPSGNQLLGFG